MRILAILAGVLSMPSHAHAQAAANAQIHGVVTDASGALVPTARIKVTQADAGQIRSTVDWLQSSKHALYARYFVRDLANPTIYDGNLLTITRAGLEDRTRDHHHRRAVQHQPKNRECPPPDVQPGGTDFELRFEFFNLLNHTNFANPVNNLRSTAFGTISTRRIRGFCSCGEVFLLRSSS